MPDTRRTLSALQALLADNTAGDISAQDVRDLLVSVMPLVEIETASASANLIFSNFSSLFNTYEFIFEELVCASNAVDLYMTVSVDGGSSYLAGTDYIFANRAQRSDGSDENYNSTGAAQLSLAHHNAGNVWENESNENLSGFLRLVSVNGSRYKHAFGQIVTDAGSNGAVLCTNLVSGSIKTGSAITHVKFAPSTGNITSGSILMVAR